MIRINTIGISLDTGIIPPVSRVRSKIYSIGLNLEYGVIPPKNYYRTKISSIGISLESVEDSEFNYQIM